MYFFLSKREKKETKDAALQKSKKAKKSILHCSVNSNFIPADQKH